MTWDQIHPGMIFPKAEVTAIAFDHVAVKLSFDSGTFNGVLKGRYIVEDSRDESKVVRTIKSGQVFNNIVVIGKDARTQNVEVACFKYQERLITYFRNYFSRSMRSQLAAWEMDARESYNEQCAQFIDIIDKRTEGDRVWVEVQGKYSAIFVQKDRFTDHLEGHQKFYPESVYGSFGNQNSRPVPPLCTYKTDDAIELPLSFSADLEIKRGNTRKVKICLHCLPNPIKYHTNVRKHVIGDSIKRPDEQGFWQCNPRPYVDIFQDCPKQSKNGDWQCDAHICHEKNLFAEKHLLIKEAYKNFLITAVTFFEKSQTIPIWIGSSAWKQKDVFSYDIKILYSEQRNHIKDGKLSPLCKLVFLLKGVCHNFHADNPIFHLIPITLYSIDYKYNKDENDTSVWNTTGKLLNIKRL